MDVSWVPCGCKLFLVFDPTFGSSNQDPATRKAGTWQAAVRLRSDYLGYVAVAYSDTVEGALAEVRTKITYATGAKLHES